MTFLTTFHKRAAVLIGIAALALIASMLAVSAAQAHPASSSNKLAKPTIVLVHGAYADASGWNGVSERLQRAGYTVYAPANPLRGVSSDSAYLSAFLDSLPAGPIVLVGHSYGGVVITNAATGRDDVKALVYVAAFAPAAGESVFALAAMNPGSLIEANTVARPAPGGETDLYLAPAAFQKVFIAEASKGTAATMAAAQRPLALTAGIEPSGTPAWATIPSWFVVTTKDNAIPPATQLFMANRAHGHTVKVSSSHAVMVVHPGPVTDVIESAAKSH